MAVKQMNNKDLNILVVEDEIISLEYLLDLLNILGYLNIFSASRAEEALEVVKTNKIDLVFMDININGSADGLECANTLNEEYFLPVIYTTAYDDDQTILEATNTNIFGYIIKPFEKNELQATLLVALKRIKSYLLNNKTIKKSSTDQIELGNNQKYNFFSRTFYINNLPINLTKKENDILYILCKNLNQNISYETLVKYVWENKDISNSTIRDTFSRLKKKAPNLNIENIVNFGYILKT